MHGLTPAEKRGNVGSGREHLFAIVENDEHLPWMEGITQHLGEEPLARLAHAQCGGQSRENEGRVMDGGEVDEDDPIGECWRDIVGDRQGEPRLAYSTGPGYRQERNCLVEEQCAGNDAFGFPADEAGAWDRRRRTLQRCRRGAHRWFPGRSGDGSDESCLWIDTIP